MMNNKKIKNNFGIKIKKVLVFGITENPGGVESVIMNYYRALDRSLIQFDFLCNTREVAYEDEITALGGKVYRIAMRSVDRKQYRKDLTAFYEAHQGEYCAIWVNICSLANIDYLIYAKRYEIPVRIVHSHNSQNMDSKLRGMLHRLNKLRIAQYATDYWACSVESGKWFYPDRLMQSDKFRLVHNAIDLSKYSFDEQKRTEVRKELGLEGKYVVGNVGRLHFQKNQSFLLDIFAEILKRKPEAHLLIVGQGVEEDHLRQKIRELKLERHVSMLGVRNDVNDLYQAMDVFVLPSLFEGLALVMVEVQANSLPCFASADVIPPEAKMTENFQFISLSESASAWAEKILNNNYDRRKDGTEGITHAGYNMEHEIENFRNFFCNI